eukprot:CCRYP_016352-RA/>CCRYP_016352-RA protein AED:0.05 eAED:0.05 QI:125/1/1/1/1/1/5/313/824
MEDGGADLRQDAMGTSDDEHGAVNDFRLKSIRTRSFVDTYFDIKELEEDELSLCSTIDSGKHAAKLRGEETGVIQNFVIDMNPLEESNRSYEPFEGVDFSNSKPILEHKSSARFNIDESTLQPSSSRRNTAKRSNTAKSASSNDSNAPHPGAQDIEAKIAPPNFAESPVRRKGSLSRRMLLNTGLGRQRHTTNERVSNRLVDDEDDRMLHESRRNSTDMTSKDSCISLTSLASFTSDSSVTSGRGVEVGNLTFVSDVEMISIMYGDENDTDDDSDDATRRSYSSLPPSAVLGRGSYATVRLAWRKSKKSPYTNLGSSLASIETDSDIDKSADKVVREISALQTAYKPKRRQSRRSIVRVVSPPMDDGNEHASHASAKGDLVAVKVIQKSILKQMKTMTTDVKNRVTVRTAFENIEREIAMMKRLRHPNLVQLFEVIDSVESDKLYMVLEYVSLGEILSHVEGTDMYKRTRYKKRVKGLTPGGYFDEKNAALYFVDIMHGLAYLHRHEICHRDLKPENILLGANGIAKISDFGVAHMFSNEKDEAIRESLRLSTNSNESFADYLVGAEREKDPPPASHLYLTTQESDQALMMPSQHTTGLLNKTDGTWFFYSPEMCDKNTTEFSGYAADLWAAGVCLYIFTTGRLPFFSTTPLKLFELIANAEVPYHLHEDMSDSLKGILQKLLTKDPSERAGVGFCLQHEFCSSARIQRLNELGKEFDSSDGGIVLTKEEVKTAFSVTMLSSMFENVKKRGNAVTHDDGNEDEVPCKEETTVVQALKPSTSTMDSAEISVAVEPVEQRSRKILIQSSSSKLVQATRSKPVCSIQ